MFNANSLFNQDFAPISISTTILEIPHDRAIVFVDRSLTDYKYLMRGVVKNIEIVESDRSRNGIAAITSILSQKTNIADLHLISRSSSGEIRLGNAILNLMSCAKRAFGIDFSMLKSS